jgi:hypothetical protein
MNKDTVKTITIKHLADECYDGLYSEPHGCACKLSDLMPCTNDMSACCPGVLKDGDGDGNNDSDFNFFIGERK